MYLTSWCIKFQSQRRAMPKSVQTTIQLCSFHTIARLCSKSFKSASVIHELRTSRCTSWKRQRNQRSNCQASLDHRESKGISEKHLPHFIDYAKLRKILKKMGIPDHLTTLLRKLMCGSRSISYNRTWNSGLVQNWERST